ncbi:hypothetical protein JDV02_010044 [Purpureocillium takamizusanense]|uniref:Uncharacterized protein n=1 Tax=Purpureocillium takamizusanense TaxID=2060973 RepID=A0A9Q8QR86_9HYPO|nr:uncharacterized protein JDV02_010044 [Purpureocillium takamizusanense]UNI24285.1 hypothetical protein JDV02_010044 [Purpureocillium takamizusanense]
MPQSSAAHGANVEDVQEKERSAAKGFDIEKAEGCTAQVLRIDQVAVRQQQQQQQQQRYWWIPGGLILGFVSFGRSPSSSSFQLNVSTAARGAPCRPRTFSGLDLDTLLSSSWASSEFVGMHAPARNAAVAPALPVELVLHIVDSVAPSNPCTILPPTDEVTKTLLSLSRVCRATYPAASKKLRQHCVYIDSNNRARRFARYLGGPLFDHSGSMARVHHLTQITQMFLSPFTDEPRERSRSIIYRDVGDETSSDHSWDLTAPSPLDLPTALAVRDIFRALAPYLRRLVIDMPLRSLYPDQDRYRVRPVLRSAFQALVNLEEFTSVQDELFLNAYSLGRGEPLVWLHCWKKLRRLCIYNPDIASQQPVWDGMVLHPSLQIAIFARADMNDITEEDMTYSTVDMKKAWFNSRSRIKDIDPSKSDRAEKSFTIVLVDCGGLQPTLQSFAPEWRRLDPENRIQILLSDAPESDGSDGFQNPIALTQTYLRDNAVRGTLFDDKAMSMRQAIGHEMETGDFLATTNGID